MKKITLFVFAEKSEIDLDLNQNILNKTIFQSNQMDLCIYTNLALKKDYALLICGVGKVNAASSLSIAIWKLKEEGFIVENIINIGPVGSSQKNGKITEAFLINKAYFFDVDLRAIEGYKLGELPNNEYEFQTSNELNSNLNKFLKLELKNIVSADRFFSINDTEIIEKNFNNCTLLDMEVCALIKVANTLKIKIASIKIISDNIFSSENYYITKKEDWKNKVLEVFLAILKEI
ncbi:phosphorylase family protein [Metamycoplasma auris]|uniref:Methylthioadenosine nucleosidase /adenosylhomocysteine nucleosidase n=1 Tax=Metamycoplasma auris TaxID=51363 RepID=A0A2W7G4K1_9BACT|nr:5'-methylthioadenosine nucleosidase [Metamycoplasma auris]PZW01512.1 methylthioadenosine nucleosidase /adenosylhomocysteine nucleosidase [Metamycoplasma auris]